MEKKKQKIINNILDIISANKSITLISEVLAEIPELKEVVFEYQLDKNKDILEALNRNKILMKRALKMKLYRANTATSLIELNKILEAENNGNKTNNFIDKLVQKWRK